MNVDIELLKKIDDGIIGKRIHEQYMVEFEKWYCSFCKIMEEKYNLVNLVIDTDDGYIYRLEFDRIK